MQSFTWLVSQLPPHKELGPNALMASDLSTLAEFRGQLHQLGMWDHEFGSIVED